MLLPASSYSRLCRTVALAAIFNYRDGFTVGSIGPGTKTPPVSVSGRQRLNLMAVVGERLMILSPLVDTAVLPVVALRTVVLRLARRSIGRVALLAGFSIGRP